MKPCFLLDSRLIIKPHFTKLQLQKKPEAYAYLSLQNYCHHYDFFQAAKDIATASDSMKNKCMNRSYRNGLQVMLLIFMYLMAAETLLKTEFKKRYIFS